MSVSQPPVVSVLVTVYNREQYLQATLDSILQSSFSDFEIVVVDDGSSDGSLDIARKAAQSDPRIRVQTNPSNLGDYGNRMQAASLARGKYLKYVDSDDLIYPHGLQVMVDALQRYPDAALALAHSMPEDISPYPWYLDSIEAYRKHFLGRGCMSCGPTGAIIRRDAFDAVGGFRKQWGVLSDSELWYRLAAEYPVVLLPPGLVWWRRHDAQEFTKDDASDVYMRRGYELDIAALRCNCPLSEIERNQAIDLKKKQYARRIISLALRKRRVRKAWRLYRDSNLSIADMANAFVPRQSPHASRP
ncbi:Putative glycosyltransferase EpsH [Rosistilla carotiformis]|uniref:Glycosyltransferase EpsH n=1 Tax=Rosistilla carotiformis TaxID=2528017 RepID=A0A518JVE8_9BACT|nr:glycosyltransferase family 2 protein [Rosistilla carotiformis]QDV69522.1 Putative glycosyltransferase EpsH [Rosistilla carotiformis]